MLCKPLLLPKPEGGDPELGIGGRFFCADTNSVAGPPLRCSRVSAICKGKECLCWGHGPGASIERLALDAVFDE